MSEIRLRRDTGSTARIVRTVCAIAVLAALAWNNQAFANVYAQTATGYDCTACHVNVGNNVTRAGLTTFGSKWQDQKCPTKQGNLCQ
jgi:hypothetical protein